MFIFILHYRHGIIKLVLPIKKNRSFKFERTRATIFCYLFYELLCLKFEMRHSRLRKLKTIIGFLVDAIFV